MLGCDSNPNTFWTTILILAAILMIILFMYSCKGVK